MTSDRRPRRVTEHAAVFLLLAAAVVAAHGGALRGEFHYDDLFAIVQNPAVQVWQPMRYVASGTAVINETNAAGYRPLTVASFALNYRWGGATPFGYLLVNLLLHLMIAWLVYLVGRELLREPRWAAVAAVVWAVHPLNAEAVNYAAARSSLLATLFALMACGAYLRRVERHGGAGWIAVGLASFLAALLSKESAVALVAPLLAYGPLRAGAGWPAGVPARPWRVGVREALPYAALAVLYVILWRVVTAGGLVPPGPAAHPAWVFAEMAARSLALWVWPWPLGLDHPLTTLVRVDRPLAAGLVAGGLGLAAAMGWCLMRARLAAWTCIWIVAGLAPLAALPWVTTAGLLQEHRIGWSGVGLAWLTAAVCRALWHRQGGPPSLLARRVAVSVGVLLALGAVALDRARSAVWNDDRALWEEVVRRSPDDLPARINLGAAFMERGDLDRAEATYRALAARAPTYPRVHYNLGLLALRRENPNDAAAAFARAATLNPSDAGARAHLGLLALRRGDAADAEAEFQRALSIDPVQRDSLNNLGALYMEHREWARALDLFTRALEKEPLFLEAAYNRAVALSALHRDDEARDALRVVRSRLPPEARFDQYRKGVDHLLAGGRP